MLMVEVVKTHRKTYMLRVDIANTVKKTNMLTVALVKHSGKEPFLLWK